MKDRIAFWIVSYRKECAKHEHKKMMGDRNKLVKPADVQKFKTSKVALSAVKIRLLDCLLMIPKS